MGNKMTIDPIPRVIQNRNFMSCPTHHRRYPPTYYDASSARFAVFGITRWTTAT